MKRQCNNKVEWKNMVKKSRRAQQTTLAYNVAYQSAGI